MRITNPIMSVPGAMKAMLDLSAAAAATGLDKDLVELICLRVSIVNGCGACIDYHTKLLREAKVADERIWAIAGWRDVPYYSDAEKAAFALAEEMTHVQVSDAVWDEAAQHWSERELAGLMLAICAINTWNRLNVGSRQEVSA
ncbi:carboxymuconolactone decarboxylase family protein [Lentzea sp. NPDC060358]|uniref:carboxymuconolactone decarboxylase family protein n=1 Tax=Lentzea sp. NPDC060358 TaxID=3347103 RepID=UPI00365EA8CB